MALFPRLVGGHHLALSRTDGENISLARSADGVIWDDVGIVHRPTELWELVQLGNCGAPIETDRGLARPHARRGPAAHLFARRAAARPRRPVAGHRADDRRRCCSRPATCSDGYVPRVVYSCGAIAHRGTLWIPVGVGDSRIRVFSVAIDELIASMVRPSSPRAASPA